MSCANYLRLMCCENMYAQEMLMSAFVLTWPEFSNLKYSSVQDAQVMNHTLNSMDHADEIQFDLNAVKCGLKTLCETENEQKMEFAMEFLAKTFRCHLRSKNQIIKVWRRIQKRSRQISEIIVDVASKALKNKWFGISKWAFVALIPLVDSFEEEYKDAIREAGGIIMMIEALRVGSIETKVYTISMLELIMNDAARNNLSFVNNGGIASLVTLVRTEMSEKSFINRALDIIGLFINEKQALVALGEDDRSPIKISSIACVALREADGIPMVISSIGDGFTDQDKGVKAIQILKVMWNEDDESRKVIRQEGVLELMLIFARNGNLNCKVNVLFMVACVIDFGIECEEYRAMIREQDGINTFLTIVREGTKPEKKIAVNVIFAFLKDDDDARAIFCAAGGVDIFFAVTRELSFAPWMLKVLVDTIDMNRDPKRARSVYKWCLNHKAQDNRMMTCKLNDLKGHTFFLKVTPDMLISDVKEKAAVGHGLEATDMQLIYHGIVLKDANDLKSYSFNDGDYMVVFGATLSRVSVSVCAALEIEFDRVLEVSDNLIECNKKESAFKLGMLYFKDNALDDAETYLNMSLTADHRVAEVRDILECIERKREERLDKRMQLDRENREKICKLEEQRMKDEMERRQRGEDRAKEVKKTQQYVIMAKKLEEERKLEDLKTASMERRANERAEEEKYKHERARKEKERELLEKVSLQEKSERKKKMKEEKKAAKREYKNKLKTGELFAGNEGA